MDSFISWIGGKKLLRKAICSRYPEKIGKYIEVFGGAGWVLFYKDKHAQFEIYNDINGDLVNLFKCVKHHPNAIAEEMELVLNSREFFNDCKKLYNSEVLTDIQRAAKYLYMIKVSYGSKIISFGAKPRDVTNSEYLRAVKERLKAVIIENKSYEALIKQYDTVDSFFYCDPPYYKAEQYYNTGGFVFNEGQHINLCDILKDIRGKFILSYNDDGFIRHLYKEFHIEEVERANNLAARHGKDKTYKELIIRNY